MRTARMMLALLVAVSMAIPVMAMAGVPQEVVLDPPAQRHVVEDDAPLDASANLRFVKNLPYPNGTDIEFAEFTVRKLDEAGNPICETDAEGNCVVDEEGNIVFQTEQRDYAFAGAQNNPAAVRIVDITDPENATVVSTVNCNISQADIQLRPDLGLLVIGVDANSAACGMGSTQGIIIVDVKDPRFPVQLSVFKSARGAHNATFHPTEPLVYLSDSDVASTGLGAIPIVDVSDPKNPVLVRTFTTNVHSPHDIFFNAAGTRAYTASVSHSDILNTTDPRNPSLITTIYDPAVNIHHDTQVTPDGRTLIIGDEIAGAAAGPQCPGGGLHFYDITNEADPRKTGVFFAPVTKSATSLCTAHVFRINPDGKSLVIAWYNGGTRVVDISDPAGVGPTEIGYMIPSGQGGNNAVANSWASKQYKGYIYSNDRARGLDIMQWMQSDELVEGSQGVLAMVDTGINPYHRVFRSEDPRAMEHPSTYIPGYPADAVALPISLDEPTYAQAVTKDCNLWKSVQPGKLYWFPGTKVVGGVSFSGVSTIAGCTGTRILDGAGHGTMVASRATATEYGACKECHVVGVQFPTSIPIASPGSSTQPAVDAIRWAANNSGWVDGQSNSWGPFAPAWDPTGAAGLLTANPAIVRAVEEVSAKHAAFWASGNGAAFRGGVVGHPTILSPHMTPSAIIVGGMDSGYINTWPGFPPHVVSDSCNSWAAHYNSTTTSADNVGGGTSGATPFVAGGAVRILMEARRILGDQRTGVRAGGVVAEAAPGVTAPGTGPLADGKLTLQEWRDVTFKTAEPRPARMFEDGSVCDSPLSAPYNTTPVKWGTIPRGVPAVLYIGYGAVDRGSMQLAFRVLRGKQDMPDRTVEDTYFGADRQARAATYEVFSKP